MSIAQCEFWSDTLDRWAEDLVDPACSGTCPGGKSREQPAAVDRAGSAPDPRRRRSTSARRPASPSRPGPRSTSEEYGEQAGKLSDDPGRPARRASTRSPSGSASCPTARRSSRYEIGLLGQVATVMDEATDILARPGDRRPGDRRGDRGDRALAPVEADQPQGRRRRRLDARRRRPRHDPGLGPRPARQRREREGSARRPRRLAGDRRLRARRCPRSSAPGLDEYFNRLERGPGGN